MIAVVTGSRPVMKRKVCANASAWYDTSRWSRAGSTMFLAPFSAGPSALTLVAMPRWLIHTPSGCANLSLLSERSVIHNTPGVTSSPLGPLGALSALRNGPAPLNSLPRRKPGNAQTPWFGVPPRMACDTVPAPPPFWM